MHDDETVTALPADNQLGRQFGVYRVEALLGAGGMGYVFRAVDTRLKRPVALKICSARFGERFAREARAISAFNHPHVCTLYDIGPNYLVMELIDGETLSAHIGKGPLPIAEVLRYGAQIADALTEAHQAGIVHHDLKPGNVMISRHGVKVLDFGLAKMTEAAEPTITQSFAVMGTPAYMAPEQIAGRRAEPRSDLFALGLVLYEMTTGQLPLPGASLGSVLHKGGQATVTPPSRIRTEASPALDGLIARLLAADPARRPAGAALVAAELRAIAAPTARGVRQRLTAAVAAIVAVVRDPVARRPARSRLRWSAALIAGVAVIAAGYAGVLWWQRAGQANWAREQALPEIERLADAGELLDAYELAARVRAIVPDDPLLQRLTPLFTGTFSLTSTPTGAYVYVRDYTAVDAEWQLLGSTPLTDVQVPRRMLRWRIEMPGFNPVERVTGPGDLVVPEDVGRFNVIDVTLRAAGGQDADMVDIPAGTTNFGSLPVVMLDAFRIERYEVTNAAWKQFVDAGGYTRRGYWEGLDFIRDGKRLSIEQALVQFVDSTGRPGPAGWEFGGYPAGQDRYPVTGISWYEAMAYARFRGRTLPTVHHWTQASLPRGEIGRPLAPAIVANSNYEGANLVAIGSYQGVGPFGTYDMFGNAAEWTQNRDDAGAWVKGGDWREAAYNFSTSVKVPLMARSDRVGLRLMQASGELPAVTLGAVDELQGTGRTEQQLRPASDEVYAAYAAQYAYRSADLRVGRLETVASTAEWTHERVSIDAGYGDERLDVNLYIPTGRRPRYQALVYFPSLDAVQVPRSRTAVKPGWGPLLDFVWKSGRVLVFPVWQGTFDRFRAPFNPTDAVRTQREWVERRFDLGRTIDYLETRADIDAERIGYVGLSFGASFAAPLLALEPRLKTAILIGGGLPQEMPQPAFDLIHFLPRITQPVLMVNGRYDPLFLVDTMQTPMFDRLGTPPADKRHALSDAGHVVPRSDLLRESLAWLDKYLGPVR
jgi:predicted Ser/Thr protein kinase